MKRRAFLKGLITAAIAANIPRSRVVERIEETETLTREERQFCEYEVRYGGYVEVFCAPTSQGVIYGF